MSTSSIDSLPMRVWDKGRTIEAFPGTFYAYVYDDRKRFADFLKRNGYVVAAPAEEAFFRHEPRPNPIRCAMLVCLIDESQEDQRHIKSIVVKKGG